MRFVSCDTAILVGTLLGLGAGACSRAPKAAPAASSPGDSGSAVVAEPAPAAKDASAAVTTFPVPKASVDYVLNPQSLPPYDGPTGSVEGTIYVRGPEPPNVTVNIGRCPAALDTYGKQFREGPALPNGSRPLADAAVVVVGYTGSYVPEREEAKRVTIGANCAYPTRTITMTYGQRLEVTNETKMLFGPMIDQGPNLAVMVAPPQGNGDPVRLYPDKAGYFTISDRLVPFVHEDLYVFRHPLHTVSDLSGHYRIDGLPVGALKVGVYHPGVEAEAEAPIDVIAGLVKQVDLTITYKPKPVKRIDPKHPPVRVLND
jgi:hypothetical protein